MQSSLKTNLVETIRKQLALYGLNPAQWEVEPQQTKSNIIHIRHRRQNDFRMKADIRHRRNQISITQLSVVSI